jgi:hypothetical protein
MELLDRYLDELPEILASITDEIGGFDGESPIDSDGDAEISIAVATNAVSIVYYLWRQRKVLKKLGIESMPDRPWPAFKGTRSIANFVSTKALGWIRPLPDEVAVPLLNKVFWFLGAPAEDIIRLNGDLNNALTETSHDDCSDGAFLQRVVHRQNIAAEAFLFSTLSGQCEPWHSVLCNYVPGSPYTQASRCRHLVLDLQAACCIAIQGLAGLRVSDLCGLKCGCDPSTGLPTGVTMRLSVTGLNEEFVLSGETSKRRSSPREEPWLLGSRRVGDVELPVAVKAIQVVDRLMAPWRELVGTDQLLLSITCSVGLPKRHSIPTEN